MGYVYLTIAILSEVIATASLKACEEFTKPIPSAIVIIGYLIAFGCLCLTLRTIPVGIAYAIWAGCGIVLIVAVSTVLFKQVLDLPALIGVGFIIAGVVIVNGFSHTVVH